MVDDFHPILQNPIAAQYTMPSKCSLLLIKDTLEVLETWTTVLEEELDHLHAVVERLHTELEHKSGKMAVSKLTYDKDNAISALTGPLEMYQTFTTFTLQLKQLHKTLEAKTRPESDTVRQISAHICALEGQMGYAAQKGSEATFSLIDAIDMAQTAESWVAGEYS